MVIDQNKLLNRLKDYFGIEELVDKTVYNKYGEKAWRFFDPRLIHNLWWIRTNIAKSITVNNWSWGGSFDERGLRTNISPLVKSKNRLYLTAHLRGAAVDFDVKGMSANDVRGWIKDNELNLPYPCRLERRLNGNFISWVHLDVDYEPTNPKVYMFDI